MLGDAVVDTAVSPLREKRAALRGRIDGEQRKLVTVLFSDLVDFTVLSQRLDAEDVRSVVNTYFARWQEQIAANGGVTEKFIGDAVMAVFGLHQAREDDPHRAIRAALGLRDSLQDLNDTLQASYGIHLRMRVGIDTGEVVVGLLDERPGQELAVVGETVNRASRLQSVAPEDGILISSDTLRHVRGSFGLQPRLGLQLKGIAEPVDAYLVLAERPRGFRLDAARGIEGVETRTIGRELELRELQDHFRDVVEERQWRVVTVVGDAGVGKSRVLGELDRWLAEIPDDLWWFRGRASPSGENRPNALLRDVIVGRLEIQESDGPEEVAAKWHRGFERVFGPGDEARRKGDVIARWLGFDLGAAATTATSGASLPEPQWLRERAIEYTAECFRRLAEESPVVVLLEDLHWADDGSLDWMDDAEPLLRSSPVLVVATARPALFERRPHWGEGRSHHAAAEAPLAVPPSEPPAGRGDPPEGRPRTRRPQRPRRGGRRRQPVLHRGARAVAARDRCDHEGRRPLEHHGGVHRARARPVHPPGRAAGPPRRAAGAGARDAPAGGHHRSGLLGRRRRAAG